MIRRYRTLAFAGLIPVALLGCGGDSEADVGQPGDKARSSRTVEVRQVNGMRFEPSSVEVSASETVTFKITNTGTQIHEFFLGDQKAQDARDDEMKSMGAAPMKMPDLTNGVTVEPGETKELAWTFPEKGTVAFACHQPGHYSAGMKGTAKVG